MEVAADLLNFYHEKLSVAGTLRQYIPRLFNLDIVITQASCVNGGLMYLLCSVHVVQSYNTPRAVYNRWC